MKGGLNMDNREELREELLDIISNMDDGDFWKWVSQWLDVDIILDMVENWSDEAISDELETLRDKLNK